jgi:hypothetical protein
VQATRPISHQKNGIEIEFGTLLSSQTTGPPGIPNFFSGIAPAERGSKLPSRSPFRKSADHPGNMLYGRSVKDFRLRSAAATRNTVHAPVRGSKSAQTPGRVAPESGRIRW